MITSIKLFQATFHFFALKQVKLSDSSQMFCVSLDSSRCTDWMHCFFFKKQNLIFISLFVRKLKCKIVFSTINMWTGYLHLNSVLHLKVKDTTRHLKSFSMHWTLIKRKLDRWTVKKEGIQWKWHYRQTEETRQTEPANTFLPCCS